MQKIVITSVPYTDTTAPIMAPAVLKGIADKAGYDSYAFDLNAIVHKEMLKHPQRIDIQEFFYYGKTKSGLSKEIDRLFKSMTKLIVEHDPDIVCLSLLHYQCQITARWLCYHIKKHNKNIKIVIGGSGIGNEGLSIFQDNYPKQLKKLNLIDHFIVGDGETAFYELLTGNLNFKGVDSLGWNQIDDLEKLPYPNYDNYDFSLYKSPFIGLVGSRGCVRKCTFCDVHEYWTKFNWRSAESIFQEMLYQNKKHGCRTFKFHDSLINGNVKEYNKLVALLSSHNQSNPNNSLSWSSFFIFRPVEQMSEEVWKNTAASGAANLIVGVENLVEKNRLHLKKNFDNAALDHGLAMAKKYNINLILLIIIGYVTETEEDHKESLQWFYDHREYAGNPVVQVSMGTTLQIIPGTYLDRNQKELGVTWLKKDGNMVTGKDELWEIKSTGNNYETRQRRAREMVEAAQKAGFNTTWRYGVIENQKGVEQLIADQMNKFRID